MNTPLDLCLTTLARPPGPAPAPRPWTEVLESAPLARVRDAADRLYRLMDAAGAVVPTVTLAGGAVRIEYAGGDAPTARKAPRVAVFLLEPNEVRFATGTRGTPYPFVAGDPVDALVARIAGWVVEGVPL